MAEILNDYSDNSSMSGNRASNGGQQTPKDLPYSPPQGPKGITQGNGPGIGGTNHGNNGTQGRR